MQTSFSKTQEMPVSPPASIPSRASLVPLKVFCGSNTESDERSVGIRLQIANGGTGQTGINGAFANAFIDYEIRKKGRAPFQVEYLPNHS